MARTTIAAIGTTMKMIASQSGKRFRFTIVLFHQLSGLMRDKYDRPEQVSSSGSLSPACHLLCR
jgi:hypothetical protein